MLRGLAWRATDNLIREQLKMFQALADQISLSHEGRRRALDLDDAAWRAWLGFLADGLLPPEPPLSDMLRRVATAAYQFSLIADPVLSTC